MVDINKVNSSIDTAVGALLELKKALAAEKKQVATATPPVLEAQEVVIDSGTFEQLKTALESDKWPVAVNPNLICDPNSDKDKTERSRGIIELMIEDNLNGLKFLDYGCGDGCCVKMAEEYGTALSVGYDIKRDPNWSGNITDDFNYVRSQAPYNVILLFDVLDHLQNETPVDVLRKLESLLADNGKIYMRVHPFTSRHGTHFYHTLNKAYLHLVFTEDELKQIVPDSELHEESIGVKYPIRTYNEFIDQSGLRTVNRRDLTERVEPFFKIPKIAERIMKNLEFGEFPEFQMGLQFLDYVLEKK